MKKTFLLLFVALLLATLSSWAQTTTVKLYSAQATAATVGGIATSTEHFTGSGAWKNDQSKSKMELYLPLTALGTFTIDDIASLQFSTKKALPIPSTPELDFFMAIYTNPYAGGFGSWYGQRLNSEPMYYNGYNAPYNQWSTYKTDAGANQMTFFDSNHSIPGFYGAPTLNDIQNGLINFSGTAPYWAAGSGIDYGSQTVKTISVSTGSAWNASMVSYLDDIEITLKNGNKLIIDLEDQYPAPITTIGTPTSTTCGTFDVPVTVQDFSNIGTISLKLNYNSALSYTGVTLNPAISAAVPNGANPGQFILSYFGSGVNLADNEVLFTLHFTLLPAVPNLTNFTWSTNYGECEYAGPGDEPVVYNSTFNNLAWTIPARPVKNFSTGYEFCTIQEAIDHPLTVNGNIIKVYPGSYNMDEANNRNAVTGGVGTSNFNIFVNKSITIQGVDASGNEIISASAVLANIIPKRNTPSGNLSSIFIQADNVTISGFDVTSYDDPDDNFKTISVIGDNATIKNCKLHNGNQVSCIYVYDPRFNASGAGTSHITKYRFEGNSMDPGGIDGASIRFSSGAGWSGDVANRIITGNTITGGSYGIEFVGPGADPWDVYPVGAATITGNTFSNLEKGHVTAWGKYNDAVGYGALAWNNILTSNTFDKGSVCWAGGVVGTIRTWDLPSLNFYYVAGIYSGIQRYSINRAAQNTDMVQVLPGTYVEGTSPLAINVSISLIGASKATTFLKPATNTTNGGNVSSESFIYIAPGANVVMKNFTVDCAGKQVHHAIQSRGALDIEDCDIMNVKYDTYFGRGIVYYAGATGNLVKNVNFTNIERIGVHVRGGVITTAPVVSIDHVTYTGKGNSVPCLDYAVEYGAGGGGTVDYLTATNCTGLAGDGSTSAAILATTYFGAGTNATITHSTLTGNTTGIHVGYDASDVSVVVAHNNHLQNITENISSTAPSVNATCNWYGTTDYNQIFPKIVGPGVVTFAPYLVTSDIVTPDCSGTVPPVHNQTTNLYYYTIQLAIDATETVTGNVIVASAATYNENVNITKSITLLGANAGAPCFGSRGSESIIVGSGEAAITVVSDGVTIDGFEITNPSENFGIASAGYNNLLVQNNKIHDIGTVGTTGNAQAVSILMSNSAGINNVKILQNCISNINNTGNIGSSGSGVFVGNASANYGITGLEISSNIIDNVWASPAAYGSGGRGAYGILINVGANGGATGVATSPVIGCNTISYLNGLWATGVGLEGDTPGAQVTNNDIKNLTGNVSPANPAYASGIKLESNDAASTVVITDNSFTAMGIGIQNAMAVTVNGEGNWWGTTGPIPPLVSGLVDWQPFLDAGGSSSSAPCFTPTGTDIGCVAMALGKTQVDVTCFGGSNGSIDLQITGGVASYSYAWTATLGGVIPAGQEDDQDLTGLTAGSYSVIVTDGNLCTQTLTVVIAVSDATTPSITTCPPAFTIEGCSTAAITGLAYSTIAVEVTPEQFTAAGGVATDNCAVTYYAYQDVVSTTTCPIVVTRTWTVKDGMGLPATCNQTISIAHLTPPSEFGGHVANASTVECESAAIPPVVFPNVQDVCGNVLTTGAPTKQVSFTNKFDVAVLLGAAPATNTWYTDRYNPAGFASASFGDDNRLKESIAASDFQGNPSFYRTQGRSYDLGAETNAMEIKLYVPSAWATSNKRMAGFWGVPVNVDNDVSGYPIVEFTSDGSVPRFQVYEADGSWVNIGLPTGFSYDTWVTLKIRLLTSGEFLCSAGSLNYVTKLYASSASVRLKSVILQGYNYDPVVSAGVTYDIYWDDFTWNDTFSALACEGAITYTYNYADCAGLPFAWTYTYTIDHVTAPVVPNDGASPVECLTSAVAPVTPTVVDVCGTSLPAVLVSTVDSPSTLTCGGTRTYNYTYTDCSGLISDWKYVYTILHATAPAEVGGPVAITGGTVECASAAIAPTTLPVVEDICGNILSPTVTSPVIGGTYTSCEGTYTYTYNYEDCAGLTFAWTYSYNIEHNTAPVVPAPGASTVACASMALAPLEASFVDQQQTTFSNYVSSLNTAVSQSFTSGITGKLTGIDVDVYSVNGPQQTFALEIYEGDGITGSKLCRVEDLVVSSAGWLHMSIPNNIAPTLTMGSQYTLYLVGYTFDSWWIKVVFGAVNYPGGQMMEYPTTSGTDYSLVDLVFKTYMNVPQVVTDVCGTVIPTPIPAISGTFNGCSGTKVFTYTYKDCADLSTDWVYTYTISAPVVNMPGAQGSTVSCVSATTAPTPPVVLDNCGRTMTVSAGVPSADPACNGTKTWTFTYTDCAEATYNWVYTYTITYSGGLANVPESTTQTVSCPAAATDPGNPGSILDACGRTVNAVLVAPAPTIPECNGTVEWRYRYTACDGSTADWTKTYTVTYSGGLTPPADGAATVAGPEQAVDPGAPADIEDACGRTVSAVFVSRTPETGPDCVGTVVYTYRYTACDGTTTADWTYTYEVTMLTLSGTLKYNNPAQKGMGDIQLRLLNSSNQQVGLPVRTIVGTGAYTFTDLCPGSYTIEVTENTNSVGGINSTDAGAVNAWSSTLIQQVKFMAGDVTNNNFVSSTDASRIQQYFVFGMLFDRSPWSYWKVGDMVQNNSNPSPIPTSFSLNMTGNVTGYDLYAMCTGDFNGSLPSSGLKSATSSLILATNSNMQVGASQEFELPLRASSKMEVGAVSMILEIPSDLVNVQDVIVNGSTVPVLWAVKGNELRIGWNSSMPANVAENGNLITLKLKTTNNFTAGQSIELALKFDPLNELADGNFKVVEGATLVVAKVGNLTVGIQDYLDNQGLNISNYPNPFRNSTTVAYTLPVDGKVTITVYNSLGQVVSSLVEGSQNAGQYSIRMDSNNLMPGIYIAKLRLTNLNVDMTGTVKLSVLK